MKIRQASEFHRNKNKTFSTKVCRLFSDVTKIFHKITKLLFFPCKILSKAALPICEEDGI